MKDITKVILLPMGCAAVIGACAPYPPYPGPQPPLAPGAEHPSTMDARQRQMEEERRRIAREEAGRRREERADRNDSTPSKPKPKKYPTAAAVPGKPGFVFNPYTHNIVDVKGIDAGKLVRDPEDNDPDHKFRVP